MIENWPDKNGQICALDFGCLELFFFFFFFFFVVVVVFAKPGRSVG